ncbi:thioredoxin domain-containing protein [Gallaecimonas mangrovi]|uniref:hypothetical protein n=1 Tax=Gallaecimonas mangrovi TaxID=2291597 RepID=UPI000E201C81|nr:hypothetical protein [Gallaecimonas mangrovi]
MKRRFLLLASALLAIVSLTGIAHAETYSFKEGKDYIAIKDPIKVAGVKGPFVMEYLWLGCPHCQALNPLMMDYEASHPAVKMVRRPAMGNSRWVYDAHVFYALYNTGHGKLFNQLMMVYHNLVAKEHRLPDMDDLEDLQPFLDKNNIDVTKFAAAMNSDATMNDLMVSLHDQQKLKANEVPFVLVGGKYEIKLSSLAGSKDAEARLTALIDYLLEKAARS